MRSEKRIAKEVERTRALWQEYAALLAPYLAGEKPRTELEYEMINNRYQQITGAMLAFYWLHEQRDHAV